jgi:NADH-quinone oxidoreductase subunit A
MLENYFPILVFILVGVAFGILPVVLGSLVAPSRPDSEKLSPYECGFEAFEDARMKFDVRYYLIAIIFILFDLEIAFLFPWAAIFKEIVAASNQTLRLCRDDGLCRHPGHSATYMPGPRAPWNGNRDRG